MWKGEMEGGGKKGRVRARGGSEGVREGREGGREGYSILVG